MANATAKLTGVVDGQTIVLCEVAVADVTNSVNAVSNQCATALSLSRPVLLDAGSVINLITVQNSGLGVSTIASVTVHLIEQSF